MSSGNDSIEFSSRSTTRSGSKSRSLSKFGEIDEEVFYDLVQFRMERFRLGRCLLPHVLRIVKLVVFVFQTKRRKTLDEKLVRLMGGMVLIWGVLCWLCFPIISVPIQLLYSYVQENPTITQFNDTFEMLWTNPFFIQIIISVCSAVVWTILSVLYIIFPAPTPQTVFITLGMSGFIVVEAALFLFGGWDLVTGPGVGGFGLVMFVGSVTMASISGVNMPFMISVASILSLMFIVLDFTLYEYWHERQVVTYMTKNKAFFFMIIFYGYFGYVQLLVCVVFAMTRKKLFDKFRNSLKVQVKYKQEILSKVAIIEEDLDVIVAEKQMELDGDKPRLKINRKLFEIEFSEIDFKRQIGAGASGKVFECEWNALVVAVKCFNFREIGGQKNFNCFEKEVEILSSLNHPYILHFYGATISSSRIGIILELCTEGDIRKFLQTYKEANKGSYPLDGKRRMLTQLASAFMYIHRRGLIHRDVKVENALVKDNHEVRVMDFGLSRFMDSLSITKTQMIGTCSYMAPEVVLNSNYSEKCDVFSFAILMYVVVTERYRPYDSLQNEIDSESGSGGGGRINVEFHAAMDEKYRPVMGDEFKECPTIAKLIPQCWKKDPDQRPCMEKVFKRLKGESESHFQSSLKPEGVREIQARQVKSSEAEKSVVFLERKIEEESIMVSTLRGKVMFLERLLSGRVKFKVVVKGTKLELRLESDMMRLANESGEKVLSVRYKDIEEIRSQKNGVTLVYHLSGGKVLVSQSIHIELEQEEKRAFVSVILFRLEEAGM